jgi:hypothetical protein
MEDLGGYKTVGGVLDATYAVAVGRGALSFEAMDIVGDCFFDCVRDATGAACTSLELRMRVGDMLASDVQTVDDDLKQYFAELSVRASYWYAIL